jgi:hypothetical protein
MSRRDRRAVGPSQAASAAPILTGMVDLGNEAATASPSVAMADEPAPPSMLAAIAEPDPTPPPPPAPTLYRVVRGNVYASGRLLTPGKVVSGLTPAEVASLAGYLEPLP